MLLAFLVGCGCRSDPVFQNVLQSDCAPPCWRGITPGVSSRGEALEILGGEFTEEALASRVMYWGRQCVEGRGVFNQVHQVELSINPVDDRVASIALAETERDLTFGDVVNVLGSPNSVMMCLVGVDATLGSIYLVYHEHGLAFATGYVSVFSNTGWQRPSAEEKVNRWIYFAPTEPGKDLFEDLTIVPCGEVAFSRISEWAGFRE